MRVFRCTEPSLLHHRLGGLQPRTTPLLGAALTGGRSRAGLRAYVVHDDGTTLGVLVLRRWSPLGWTAHPLILDPRAAPVLGRLVERSGATDMMGFVPDIRAMRPHVGRWRGATEVTGAALAPGFDWPDPPDTTRPAGIQDLEALLALAWTHAPHSVSSRWQMRRKLRASIDGTSVVVLAGEPPTVVGYATRESHTPEYDFWGHLVVHPEHRGRGLSWSLVAAAAERSRSRGAGALTLALPTNPMTVPDETVTDERFQFVWLAPPRRFRGERRLRTLAARLLDRPRSAQE
jgi:GNAT superfamily N-acetyltransferase